MKRHVESSESLDESSAKKMKQAGNSVLLNLASDEVCHVIQFLKIGEVIMLSLVNRSIHQIISDHIRIIHPYFIGSSWSISRALMTPKDDRVFQIF